MEDSVKIKICAQFAHASVTAAPCLRVALNQVPGQIEVVQSLRQRLHVELRGSSDV